MTNKSRTISWTTTAEYVTEWRFNGLHDSETMVYLSQTVFVRFNNEAFKQKNTCSHTPQARMHTHKHTHTHAHTHAHTHTHTHTLMNAIDENAMRCMLLKIRLEANTPWHILTNGSPPSFVTPLEILVIGIVRPPHIRRVHAYRPESSSALCTWNVFHSNLWSFKWRLRMFTICMKSDRLTYLVNVYVWKNWNFYIWPFVRST